MVAQRSITARILWLVLVVNGAAAGLSIVTPVVGASTRPDGYLPVYVAVQVVFLVLGFTINPLLVARRVRAVTAPNQPATGLVRLPLYCSVLVMVTWCLAGIQNTTLLAAYGGRGVEVASIVLRNLLAGMSATAVVYLLVERAIAPLYADALGADEPRRQSRVGLRARLVLAWVAGSAVPVVMFGSVLFGRSATERADVAGFAWLYVTIALVFGAGMTIAIAGSVAQPIEMLRGAFARVEMGDLSTTVRVDDGTEIGQLQDGFNRMVTGLRERQRLHDLFGRHVGEEVARLALDRDARLGGEQCDATALFVDLTGSTTLGERLPPQQIVAILNEFFAEVVTAVTAEGGWVNKFEGDAALCVFGPPLGHDDHAARAMRAAVAMRRGLLRFQERHDGLDAGIGVASGLVVAGNVGAEQRYEYTVIGDPVNSAARVTDLAKTAAGRVLVTGATFEAAGAPEGWGEAGEVVLRGRSTATALYGLRA